MSLRALVFDFDGLILDTEWSEYVTVSEVFERHGHVMELSRWAERVGTDAGDWLGELEAMVGGPVDRDGISAARRARHHELIALEDPLPGIVDLLESAHAAGLALGVASSSDTWWLEHHLDRLGLRGRFDALRGADAVGGLKKPAPDVYQATVAALGVEVAESVALEDSSHGVASATAAGLACVAIPNRITAGGDFSAASLLVESAEVLTLDLLRGLVA